MGQKRGGGGLIIRTLTAYAHDFVQHVQDNTELLTCAQWCQGTSSCLARASPVLPGLHLSCLGFTCLPELLALCVPDQTLTCVTDPLSCTLFSWCTLTASPVSHLSCQDSTGFS